MYRVAIVDDHPMVRRGLASFIDSVDGLGVCGEADSLLSALALIRNEKPDLVTIDLELKDSSGLELVKEVAAAHPHVKMLVVSMRAEDIFASRCIKAGAHGFIEKDEPPTTLATAIRHVLDGKVYLSPDQKDRMVSRMITDGVDATASVVDLLTDRELEVFELIGRAKTTREIASFLELSPKTIEGYREKIKEKLAIENATKLQYRAIQWVMKKE